LYVFGHFWKIKEQFMFCERLRFGCCSLVFADSDQKHLPRQGVSVLPTDRACIQNAPARQFLKNSLWPWLLYH